MFAVVSSKSLSGFGSSLITYDLLMEEHTIHDLFEHFMSNLLVHRAAGALEQLLSDHT